MGCIHFGYIDVIACHHLLICVCLLVFISHCPFLCIPAVLEPLISFVAQYNRLLYLPPARFEHLVRDSVYECEVEYGQ